MPKMLLFSDDLTLSYDLLIQYDSLRFQIEFVLGIGRFYEYWGNSSQQCGESFLVYGDFFADHFI